MLWCSEFIKHSLFSYAIEIFNKAERLESPRDISIKIINNKCKR
jgi:hypothetical protein